MLTSPHQNDKEEGKNYFLTRKKRYKLELLAEKIDNDIRRLRKAEDKLIK